MTRRQSLRISEALLWISSSIRQDAIRSQIGDLAVKLLVGAYKGDYRDVLEVSGIIRGLIELGQSVHDIEPMNASVLASELDNLDSAMRQKLELPSSQVPDIQDFFESSESTAAERPESHVSDAGEGKPNSASRQSSVQAIRQSKIIETIKRSNEGRVQLKTLVSAFPGVSERTLRYDIEKLLDQGTIKRVGSGGPATHYVIK